MGFGLFEITKGATSFITAASSSRWPVAQGRVTESTLRSVGNENPSMEPAITYFYAVNGASFTGTAISPGLAFQSADLARTVLSRYPTRSIQNVYYQPDNPANAYLEPGIQPCSFLNLLLGVGAFLFGGSSVAACGFIPRYGKLKPDGKTFTLHGGHPMARVLDGALFLMVAAFAGLMYLCSRGYLVKL